MGMELKWALYALFSSIAGAVTGALLGYLLAKRSNTAQRLAENLTRPAAPRRALTPNGPAPDAATARVVDGYLTLIGMAACPTDRFHLEGATGADDVVLVIRPRDGQDPAEPIHVAMVPGKGIVSATQAPNVQYMSDHPFVLGPEHELTLTPPGATLLGRIV
jgi:hypothetical protein